MASSEVLHNEFPVECAQSIKVLILDVDGVLTDGGLYYDATSQALKRFDVQDGLGIKIAQKSGFVVAVITGLVSDAVATRVSHLGIDDYFAGFHDKRDSLHSICQKYNVKLSEVAYVGDDWVDLSVMHLVGLPIAVANAQPEVKNIAKYITHAKGGEGAVREVIRLLLQAQNKYEHVLASWSHQ